MVPGCYPIRREVLLERRPHELPRPELHLAVGSHQEDQEQWRPLVSHRRVRSDEPTLSPRTMNQSHFPAAGSARSPTTATSSATTASPSSASASSTTSTRTAWCGTTSPATTRSPPSASGPGAAAAAAAGQETTMADSDRENRNVSKKRMYRKNVKYKLSCIYGDLLELKNLILQWICLHDEVFVVRFDVA